jgi:tyrosyl-tRNA synthetase
MREQAAEPGKRAAQRRLARDLTARVHGEAAAEGVVGASRLLFGGVDLSAVGPEVFKVLAGEIPTVRLTRAEFAGLGVVDALVRAGLAASKADARRGIQQNGFSVNGLPVGEADRALGDPDLRPGGYVLLQKGRRNYALLAVTS